MSSKNARKDDTIQHSSDDLFPDSPRPIVIEISGKRTEEVACLLRRCERLRTFFFVKDRPNVTPPVLQSEDTTKTLFHEDAHAFNLICEGLVHQHMTCKQTKLLRNGTPRSGVPQQEKSSATSPTHRNSKPTLGSRFCWVPPRAHTSTMPSQT